MSPALSIDSVTTLSFARPPMPILVWGIVLSYDYAFILTQEFTHPWPLFLRVPIWEERLQERFQLNPDSCQGFHHPARVSRRREASARRQEKEESPNEQRGSEVAVNQNLPVLHELLDPG